MTDINLINAEVLTIGPDERLIIHIRDDDDFSDEMTEGLMQILRDMGLGERVLVLFGTDASFVKTES